MAERFRLTVAQLNAVLGDLKGNAGRAWEAYEAGVAAGADFVVLPEMFLTGYQTQDLGRRAAFVRDAWAEMEALAGRTGDVSLGLGLPVLEHGVLYNGYAVLSGGRVQAVIKKQMLPNDTVFDEKRVYTPAPPQGPVAINGVRVGLPICEDAWHMGPIETLEESGAELIVVPNGSPYHHGKRDEQIGRAHV